MTKKSTKTTKTSKKAATAKTAKGTKRAKPVNDRILARFQATEPEAQPSIEAPDAVAAIEQPITEAPLADGNAAQVAHGCEPAAESRQDTTVENASDTAQPGATGGKKMGILSAAAKVLEEHDGPEPLNCQQMLEQITAKGYWAPKRGGKTPAATLYAAILMEIRKKGDASRFEKKERGKFALKS